jgi:hypothetical protein
MGVDVHFVRTDSGTAPAPMTVNVWNVRFAACRTYERGDPLVAADLTRVVGADGLAQIRGTISNLSPYALTDVRLQWGDGVVAKPGATPPAAPANGTAGAGVPDDAAALATSPVLVPRLGPGESAEVSGPAQPLNSAASGTPLNSGRAVPRWRGRYDYYDTPPPADWAWAVAIAASGPRAARAGAERTDLTTATVYAKVQDAPPPATLRDPEAKVRNETVLRALVTVKAGATTRP